MCTRKIAVGCGASWRGSPGTTLSQARGERTIPETLERFQRFAIPGKLRVQMFLAPSGGKQLWLIKATWPQSVPRTKPALSSGTSLGKELYGEPLHPREPAPAVESPCLNRLNVHRPARRPREPAGSGALGTEPPGCGSGTIQARRLQPLPRAPAFNPRA